MALGDIGTVIDTGVFDAVRGMQASPIHISGDVYAVAYRGVDNDGWVSTVSIDSDGVVGAVIDTLEFEAFECTLPCLINVTGDIYAVAYAQTVNDDGIVCTFTIDENGNIGAAIIDALVFDAVRGRCPSIVHVTGDIYAIAYRGPADDGWLCTIDIDNAGNIGAATIDTWEFDALDCDNPVIINIAADVFAIAYTGGASSGLIQTFTINAVGTIGALINQIIFDATVAEEIQFSRVTGTIYCMIYSSNTAGVLEGCIATISISNAGIMPLAILDYYEWDAARGVRPSFVLNNSLCAIAYQGGTGEGWICTLEIDAAGNIGVVIDTMEFDNTAFSTDYPYILRIDDDTFAVFYQVPAVGTIRTFTIESYHAPYIQTDAATEIT